MNIKTNTEIVHPMTLPYEQETWDNAPKNERRTAFSFYHQTHPKVANVEIDNWFTIPYFAKLFAKGKQLSLYGPWQSQKNLRIGHIHFTYIFLTTKNYLSTGISASRFSHLFLSISYDDMTVISSHILPQEKYRLLIKFFLPTLSFCYPTAFHTA